MRKDRVEVGIGLYVWNGDKTIHQTLSSIINQSYKNIKIYILDNQSTDKTTEIVKKFQKRDKRVNLIIDKKKRDQAAAPRFLLNQFLKKYKYCLIISDDDIYEKKFIEVVLNKLINKKLNMVYPYFNLIDLKGHLYKVKDYPTYNENSSGFFNLIKFIIYRNCASPTNAGIFETKSLIRSYKYWKIYDSSLVNYENLMLIDFFANNKVGYVNQKLFNYRVKDRIETAKKRDQRGIFNLKKNLISRLVIFIYQFNFAIRAAKIICKSDKLNILKKIILLFIIILLYFQKSTSYVIKSFFKVNDVYKNR
jgi:glycosyltransferase involved in cell wall biosynthesis